MNTGRITSGIIMSSIFQGHPIFRDMLNGYDSGTHSLKLYSMYARDKMDFNRNWIRVDRHVFRLYDFYGNSEFKLRQDNHEHYAVYDVFNSEYIVFMGILKMDDGFQRYCFMDPFNTTVFLIRESFLNLFLNLYTSLEKSLDEIPNGIGEFNDAIRKNTMSIPWACNIFVDQDETFSYYDLCSQETDSVPVKVINKV